MSVRRFFWVSMLQLVDRIFAILRSTAYFICTDVLHASYPYPVIHIQLSISSFSHVGTLSRLPKLNQYLYLCLFYVRVNNCSVIWDVSRFSWVKPVPTRGLSVFAQGQNRPFDPKSTTEPLKAHLWLALIFCEYWKVTSKRDRSYNFYSYEIKKMKVYGNKTFTD